MGIILAFIFIEICLIIIGIFLWKKGLENKDIFKTIFGSFLCLNIIGVLISVMQVNSWGSKQQNVTNNYPEKDFKNKNTDKTEDFNVDFENNSNKKQSSTDSENKK